MKMFRGVVQLFNAVREQQKDMKSQLRQAGGSFRKQEKVIFTEELAFYHSQYWNNISYWSNCLFSQLLNTLITIVEVQQTTFQVLKTINKANFINMLSGKAMVEGEEPAEKKSRLEKEEEDEDEVEEKEPKQSSWNILRYITHCVKQAFF